MATVATKVKPASKNDSKAKEPTVMEINGKPFTRESVRDWLKSKRVVLWMDWMITEPGQMEKAIDWFIKSVTELAAA